MVCQESVILVLEIKVEKKNILTTSSELPFHVSSRPALPEAQLQQEELRELVQLSSTCGVPSSEPSVSGDSKRVTSSQGWWLRGRGGVNPWRGSSGNGVNEP